MNNFVMYWTCKHLLFKRLSNVEFNVYGVWGHPWFWGLGILSLSSPIKQSEKKMKWPYKKFYFGFQVLWKPTRNECYAYVCVCVESTYVVENMTRRIFLLAKSYL